MPLFQIKHFCPGVPMLLVGNKKGLRNDEATVNALAKSKQRPVQTEDGKMMAERYNIT